MEQEVLDQDFRYHVPYVMPADVLSAEPTHEKDVSSLRADASHEGVCYLHITHSFHDGTYLARVAAHPALILSHGYTIVFTEMQLAQACLYENSARAA